MNVVAIPALRTWEFDVRARLPQKRVISSLSEAESALADLHENREESAIGFEPHPAWLSYVEKRLNELLLLSDNWDRQGGNAIRYDVACFAVVFMNDVLNTNTSAPQIVPLASGGIQLEWHKNGIDLEVEIAAPNEIYVVFQDTLLPKDDFDDALKSDYSSLTGPISRLMSRSIS